MTTNNKKRQKKKLLFLLLMSSIWAGVITGIVLRDANKGDIDIRFYDYNKDGDLLITLISPGTAYKDEKLIAVFKDEKGNEYHVEVPINRYNKGQIDTSLLPYGGVYQLDRIIDPNDHSKVVISNDKLYTKQKIKVYKPTKVWTSHDAEANKQIHINLNNELANKMIRATFVDENNNEYFVESIVDENGEVVVNTRTLEQGHSYKLKDVHQLNTQPLTKVTNLKKVPEELLKVDKTRSFNSDGDVVVDVNLKTAGFENLADKPLVAIFKDKEGNEFKVSGQLNKKGIVHFDTSSLPQGNEYKLNRIEDDKNNVLVDNQKLSDDHKKPIIKPTSVDVNYYEIADSNNAKVKVSIDPSVAGEHVTAYFVDQNKKVYTVDGFVDAKGNVVFDTKEFDNGNEYLLDKIIKKVEENGVQVKVVNLDPINKTDKIVDKTRHFDDNGDIVIDVNLKKDKYANKEVTTIFKDKDGNEYKVDVKSKSNGKLEIPTTSLPTDIEIYLDRIVDKKKPEQQILPELPSSNNDLTNPLEVLSESHKDPFTRPPRIDVSRNENNEKIVNFDLEDALADEIIVANYFDSKGNLHKVEAVVDKNGQLEINANQLPKGETYKLSSLTQKDSNPLVKVANVKTIAPEYKIIDNSHDLSNEGNTEIIVQTNESNKDVSAVFVDEKGAEHKIPARIDENGLLVIDTKDLSSPGKYNLEKVVDANDATIVAKDDLNDYQKLPVIKPSQGWISTNPTNNEPILNIATNNPSRSGEVFDAEFDDQNGNPYKAPAKMDENGVIKIDTSSLPQGNSYDLVSINEKDSNPAKSILNLELILENIKHLDKTRSFDDKGNKVVDVNLKDNNVENFETKSIIGIFKDKNVEYPIKGIIDKKGVVHFDTSSLKNNNEYKIERVEDELNNILVSNDKLSKDHKNPIIKPTPIVISKDNEGNKVVEVELGKELGNHTIELSVVDSNGNTHKFDAIADANGKIKFDVSKLAEPELYKIDSITKKDSNPVIKVVNLDDVSNQNKTINKLNVDELNKPRNYDKDGDIVIKAKTDPLNFGEQVEAIFVDQDNNEHKVIAVVDENGNIEINTSSLPNNKSYNLKEIVSINDANKKIVADHDLANTQKDKLNKPNATIAYDGANNQLNLSNLDKDLNNQPITVTLKDHTDKELTLKGVVDGNGNVSFDTSSLPLNAIYEITKITKDSDPNQPVVNLNDVSKDQKIINKIQANQNNNDAIKQNDNGDSVIEIDLNNSSISDADKQKLKEDGNKAIFVDQNGNKHEVNVSVDGDKLVIDTAKLPSPGTYTLDQIVNKDNNPILDQSKLSETAKQPIVKPNVVVSVDENKNVHVEFKDKNLVNKDVVGVFVDKEGNEHKIPGRIDANGNVLFDTSSLPENNKYVLNKIVDPNNNDQKVANLDHINEEDRTVSKLNNGSINDANNNHLIDVTNKKPGDVVEVHYKDQDGNTVVVEKTVNDNGKVEIDPTQNPPFDPNKIYDFDKIVDPTTLPNEILVDKNDVNDKVDDINNDKTLARKIIFSDIFANPLTPTVSRVSVKLKDVNHLANNKQFVLTIAKKDDPTKTKKFVATLNENTDDLVLEFDYADLELNTTYKFNNLDFYVADDSIKLDFEAIKNFEFTTPKSNQIAKVNSFKFLNQTPNSIDVKLNLDKDTITNLGDDQPIFIDFKPINPDGSLGKIQTIKVSKQDSKASISDLAPNQKYVIVDTYTKENDKKNSLLLSTNASNNNVFGTSNTPISIDIQANNSQTTKIEDDAVSLTAKFVDRDQKLQPNNTVSVELKDENNNIVKASGIVKANNEIAIIAKNLKPNTAYEITKIVADQLNEGSNLEYSFKPITNNKFRTLDDQTFLTALSSSDRTPTNTNNVEATIILGGDNAENKQVVLVYESSERNQVYVSQPQTLSKNKQQYTFVFNNLDTNTRYNFSKLVYVDQDDDLSNNTSIKTINNEAITNSFNIDLNPTTLSDYNNKVQRTEADQATVSFRINNSDKVIEANQELEAVAIFKDDLVKLSSSDNTNDSSVKGIGVVKVVDDQFIVEFNFANIVLNKEYVITTIKFKNKPTKAYFDLNNKVDNIIYTYQNQKATQPSHEGYDFINKISINNFTTPNFDVEATTRSVVDNKVVLNVSDGLGNKLWFKAKYVATTDPNDVKYTNVVQFSDSVVDANNPELKELNFSIENLNANRKYKFVELMVAGEENKDSFEDFVSIPTNNLNNFLTVKTSQTTLINPRFETTANSAIVKLEISSHDNVFENDQIVNGSFKIVNQNDNPQPFNVNGRVLTENDKKYVVFELNNLSSTTKYELLEAKFGSKPHAAFNNLNNNDTNTVFTKPSDERSDGKVEFNTTNSSFKVAVVDALNKEITDTSVNKNTVNVTITNDGTDLINKYIRAIYTSNDGIVTHSDALLITNISQDVNNPSVFALVFNALKHNREYTFTNIEFSSTEDFATKNVMPNVDNLVIDKFKLTPRNVVPTDFSHENVRINDATTSQLVFKITLDDRDDIITTDDINEHDKLKVKYEIANQTNSEIEHNQEVSVKKQTIEVNGVQKTIKVIEFSIDNVQNNTNYNLVEVKFTKKPIKAFYGVGKLVDGAYNNVAYDKNDDFLAKFRISNYNVKPEFNGSEDVKLNITLERDSDALFNNKYIVARVKDNNNEYYNSLPITVSQNANYEFDLSNIPFNRNYTFDGIYHSDDPNNFSYGNLNKIKVKTGVTTSNFAIAPSLTSIISNNQEWINEIKYNGANIKFKINSKDQAFALNQDVKLIFGLASGLVDASKKEFTLPLKYNETDGWFIETAITNFARDSEYKLYSANFVFDNNTHAPKAVKNFNNNATNEIYNATNNNAIEYKFSTLVGEYKLINATINNANRVDNVFELTSKDNVAINTNIQIDGDILNNKRLRLVYTTPTNTEIKSDIVNVVENQSQYTFNMNASDLANNRLYTFARIEVLDQNTETSNDNVPLNNVNANFAILRSNEPVLIASHEIKRRTLVSGTNATNTIKLVLNDKDNVLDQNDVVVIKYGYSTTNNRTSTTSDFIQTSEANVVVDNNVKYVEFTTNNLVLNQNNKIYEVSIKQKPSVAYQPVGAFKTNDANILEKTNIIFEAANKQETDQIKLENNLILTNVVSSQPAYNENEFSKNSSSITITLNKTNGLLNNKWIKAKFNALSNNPVWSNAIQVTDDSDYTLVLENLGWNRKYNFNELYYADTPDAFGDSEKKIIIPQTTNAVSIITKPSKTKVNLFEEKNKDDTNKPTTETIELRISSLDEVFTERMNVVAVFDLNEDQYTETNDSDSVMYKSALLQRSEQTGDWKLVYTLNNLKPQTSYKLKKLQVGSESQKVITSPILTNANDYLNANNNIISLEDVNPVFTTSKAITQVNAISYNQESQVNGSNTITVKIKNDDPSVYNKSFKLVYVAQGDISVETEPKRIEASDDEQTFEFTLNNLKPNKQYTLSHVILVDDANTTVALKQIEADGNKTDAPEIKKSFTTIRHQVTVSNLVQTKGNTYNEFKLSFDLNDQDDVLTLEQKPTIKVKNKTKNGNEIVVDPNNITITNKENTNNTRVVAFTISGIDLNDEYEITEISYANKPAKAHFGIGLTDNSTDNVLYQHDNDSFANKLPTFKNEFRVVSNTTWNNNASVFNFATTNTNTNGLYVNAVFKITQSDGTTLTSDPNNPFTISGLNVSNDQLSITLNNTIANRKYVLDKLYWSTTAQPTANDVNNVIFGYNNLTNKALTTAPSESNASSFHISNKTDSSATFNLTLTSNDKIFENNQDVTITFTKENSPNETKQVIWHLSGVNNSKTSANLSDVIINGLEADTKYNLTSVSYNNKPLDLNAHINNNNNFYKTINPDFFIQTETREILLNAIRSTNPTNRQNDIDIIEANTNTIKIVFDNIPRFYEGKKFRLKYRVVNQENSFVYSEVRVFERNKTEYNDININNLSRNRQYEFVGIYEYNDAQQPVVETELNKNNKTNKFATTRTSVVSVERLEQLNEFKDDKRKIRIYLNDPDNVLIEGRKAKVWTSQSSSRSDLELNDTFVLENINADGSKAKVIELFAKANINNPRTTVYQIELPQEPSDKVVEIQNIGWDNLPGGNIIYEFNLNNNKRLNYGISIDVEKFGDDINSNPTYEVEENSGSLSDVKLTLQLNDSNNNINWIQENGIKFRVKYANFDNGKELYSNEFIIDKKEINLNIGLGNANNGETFEFDALEYKIGNGQWERIGSRNNKSMAINVVAPQVDSGVEVNNLEVEWIPMGIPRNQVVSSDLYKYAQNYDFVIRGISSSRDTWLGYNGKVYIKLKLKGTAELDPNVFGYDSNKKDLIDEKELTLLPIDYNTSVQQTVVNGITHYTFTNLKVSQRGDSRLLGGYKYKVVGIQLSSTTGDGTYYYSLDNQSRSGTAKIKKGADHRNDQVHLAKIDINLLNSWDKNSGDNQNNFPTIGQSQTGYGHANISLTYGFEWKSAFADLFEYLSKDVPKSDNIYTVKKSNLDNDQQVTRNLRNAIIYRLTSIVNHAFSKARYDTKEISNYSEDISLPFEPYWNGYVEYSLQTLRFGKKGDNNYTNIIKRDPNVVGGDLVLNPMLGGMSPGDFNNRASEFMIRHKASGRNHMKTLDGSYADGDAIGWDKEHEKIEQFLTFILSLTNKWNRD